MRAIALVSLLALAAPAAAQDAPPQPGTGPYCSAEYADDLGALARAAREFEQKQAPYTYCIRSSAVYECPSYAADGTLRKTRRRVVSHGTGFGYRVDGGETLVATNDHVAEWPAVTDEEHVVQDVPSGCRKVSSSAKIVDDESDAYERDDVALSRAVTDPLLDVAVLRAKAVLPVMPWRIGRSASMRERNVVDVRGFPLGVLRANNVGKVISTGRQDEDNGWQHEDFVIDALLSPGNSGSPVFAVSCQTGEFELVGIYHARYTKGSALHTVVGIDQVRDLLTTLRRSPPAQSPAVASDGGARARLVESARGVPDAFFAFGNLTAEVRARADGVLLFEVMSREFPVQAHPALVIEDLPGGDGAGRIGRVWAGNRQGLRAVEPQALDGEARGQLAKVLDALHNDAQLAFAYRAATPLAASSREKFQEARRLERAVRQAAGSHGELSQMALDVSELLLPRFADATLTMVDVLPREPAPVPPESRWMPAFGFAHADPTPIPLARPPRG